MRHAIFLILSVFFSITFYAQNRANFHHIIEIEKIRSGYLPLVYTDTAKVRHILYGKDAEENFRVCSNLKGIVSPASAGTASVDIFSFTGSSSDPTCLNPSTKLGSFSLDLSRDSLGDPTYVYKIPFKLKTWAVATVPFRYRSRTDSSLGTVTSNLNASVSYSWTLCGSSILTHRLMSHYYILIGPFVGVTAVDLKKASVKKPSSWSSDRTNVAFSYGVSFTFGRNNIGLVLSAGADHVIGSKGSEWSYQDKPWIGFGINTSLGMF